MSDKNKKVAAQLTAALLQSGHSIRIGSYEYAAEGSLEAAEIVDIYMEIKKLLDSYEKDY